MLTEGEITNTVVFNEQDEVTKVMAPDQAEVTKAIVLTHADVTKDMMLCAQAEVTKLWC